jgi:hypothetical protein
MRKGFLVGALALLAPTLICCHMPAGAGKGTINEPVDLGDPTVNSWALTGDCRTGASIKNCPLTWSCGTSFI